MADEIREVISHAEVLIIGHRSPEFADGLKQSTLVWEAHL